MLETLTSGYFWLFLVTLIIIIAGLATNLKNKTYWYGCLALSIILLGWGLEIMTNRIDYKWYWNRVPQYFVYTGDLDVYSNEAGVAQIKELNNDFSEVILKYDSGNSDTFKIRTKTLTVKDGQKITDVDGIGEQPIVKMGILVEGLIVTLEISVYASFFGLLIGLFTGLGRISKNPLILGLSTGYVELIRGTPLLVQIFIFYFFLGTILGFERFAAGTMALALFAGAYIAEIIRAGIQSIHPGQMEAARSLGMNYFQAMVEIILPQAFKRIMPPLAGQFISLIKDSSLVSVIAITDLTKAGREVITSTFAVFEIWFTVAGMYFILTFGLSLFVRYIERRLAVSD
ncbi:MAG: amino acid ABC transporter permease [Deltaproteobacteria bacterium]|jgi:polar amino acid transport system permease protein|nr:amino acid ABC transporter permease [Deltaproteobacteria bacterium]MBT4527703.1 amino acid ABC transporter permease [Deltaproteobacteria bacterium]